MRCCSWAITTSTTTLPCTASLRPAARLCVLCPVPSISVVYYSFISELVGAGFTSNRFLQLWKMSYRTGLATDLVYSPVISAIVVSDQNNLIAYSSRTGRQLWTTPLPLDTCAGTV
jgi:hypothetical protein